MNDKQPRALALADALAWNESREAEQAADELRRQHEIIESFEQSVTDPENQPSQYGTVPLEWHLRDEALLREALDRLDTARYNEANPEVRQHYIATIIAISARLGEAT